MSKCPGCITFVVGSEGGECQTQEKPEVHSSLIITPLCSHCCGDIGGVSKGSLNGLSSLLGAPVSCAMHMSGIPQREHSCCSQALWGEGWTSSLCCTTYFFLLVFYTFIHAHCSINKCCVVFAPYILLYCNKEYMMLMLVIITRRVQHSQFGSKSRAGSHGLTQLLGYRVTSWRLFPQFDAIDRFARYLCSYVV